MNTNTNTITTDDLKDLLDRLHQATEKVSALPDEASSAALTAATVIHTAAENDLLAYVNHRIARAVSLCALPPASRAA